MTEKENIVKKSNRKEIFWNIINSLLAGAISFFSALIASGKLTFEGLAISLFTAVLICLVRFSKYWDSEQKEYSTKVFKFL